MLPEAPLPDGPLAAGHTGPGAPLGGRNRADEADLDRLDAVGEVVVSLRQGDDAVHVFGQHHPGIDHEGTFPPRAPHRLAQGIDVPDQQVRAPLRQVDREEIGSARDPEASIVRHTRSSPSL